MRAQTIPLFLARGRRAGVDVDAIAARFGLPPDVESRRDVQVPLHVLHQLPEEIARAIGDPFFGFHLAVDLPRGLYGLIEFSCSSAPNLGEAAGRLVRYHRLLDNLAELSLEEQGGDTVLTHRIADEPLCYGRHGNDFAIALFVRNARRSMGQPWSPRWIWFAHPAPADRSELARFYPGTRLEFDRGLNALAFPTRERTRRYATADSALLAVLDEQAQGLMAARPPADRSLSSLREHIRRALPDGSPRLEWAAEALRMSSRTLQRRLDQHGESFTQLVDGVRRELAAMYLAQPQPALAEVAFLLGYADLRSFERAFRRWYGTSAGRYRAARVA